MADEQKKEKRICVFCQKKEVFHWWNSEIFDKCFSCAMDYRDKMHKEFLAVLSPEQLVLFEAYSEAREEFISMVILD